MNDTQIKNYFTEYASQKTCGRFLDSQLYRPLVVPTLSRFNKFLNRLNQIPVTRTILFFITSASMWVSSCVKNNQDEMITGDSVTVFEEPLDTNLSHGEPVPVVGFIAPIIKERDSVIKCDDVIMGEVAPEQTIKILPPRMLMGDVAVDEPDTVAVTIPAIEPDTNEVIIHMIKGKVMMTDSISQKIIRKKK